MVSGRVMDPMQMRCQLRTTATCSSVFDYGTSNIAINPWLRDNTGSHLVRCDFFRYAANTGIADRKNRTDFMLDPRAPADEFLRRLPLPIAQLYRRAVNAKSARDAHDFAFYLWEAAIKLLASSAVVNYRSGGTPDPKIDERLKNLARPSLGQWWEFVRLAVPWLAQSGSEEFRSLNE